MNNRILNVYFSPGGTTRRVAELCAAAMGGADDTLDLLTKPLAGEHRCGPQDFLLVAMPVFSGRIPTLCRDMLCRLKGQNTPAAVLAVYGNRHYDDALLELCDLVEERGFCVVGAGAVIARHSIFPRVAAGRPDAADQAEIEEFARRCAQKVAEGAVGSVTVPGNRPYREAPPPQLKPTGETASCTGCGVCAGVCPVSAIAPERPTETDFERCIACTACIYHCAFGSRAIRHPAYETAYGSFREKCAPRREPEWFL